MELQRGPRKRKLTKFHCREMLFDYTQNKLDDSRVKAVEEYLSENEDLQEDLHHLKSAMKYCSELGQAELDQEFIKHISESKSLLAQVKEQLAWRNLPESARWGIEAVAISISVAMFAIFVPWDRILDWIPKDRVPSVISAPHEILVAGSAKENLNPESNVSEKPSSDQVKTEVETKAEAKSEPNKETEIASIDSNELSQIQKLKQEVKKREEAQTAKEEEGGEEEIPEEKSIKKKAILVGQTKALKGELYRAFIKLDNIDIVTQEFINKIVSLGGKKAGEVKLGWRRSDGSYFHFSLNESKLEELKKFISSYGALRLLKDPHWRVMPEGEIRMILLVEDSEPKKK